MTPGEIRLSRPRMRACRTGLLGEGKGFVESKVESAQQGVQQVRASESGILCFISSYLLP